MTIAITGANGLLGSFLATHFTAQGEQVVALRRKGSDVTSLAPLRDVLTERDADVLDFISLTESFKEVDTVIHTAAIVSFNPRKRKQIFDINVTGTKNVVDACLQSGVRKLIHISSVAALGKQKGSVHVNETTPWTDSVLHSDYATSKYQAELEVYRGLEEGLNVSIINPAVILGAGNWNRSSSQLFRYIWNEKPFYTEGVMNYVDVRDVAKMAFALHVGDFNGERFIASAGHTSFKNMFDEIAKRFGKRSPGIKVEPALTGVVAALEAIRCFFTNQEPIITPHTARMAREPFFYSNKKTVEKLKITFQTLSETLDFCCPFYGQNVTTNK